MAVTPRTIDFAVWNGKLYLKSGNTLTVRDTHSLQIVQRTSFDLGLAAEHLRVSHYAYFHGGRLFLGRINIEEGGVIVLGVMRLADLQFRRVAPADSVFPLSNLSTTDWPELRKLFSGRVHAYLLGQSGRYVVYGEREASKSERQTVLRAFDKPAGRGAAISGMGPFDRTPRRPFCFIDDSTAVYQNVLWKTKKERKAVQYCRVRLVERGQRREEN
jgi:hypothetical protein